MVAEVVAKVQAQEAMKVVNLEEVKAAVQCQAKRQARQYELALKKAKDKQATVEQEQKAVQAKLHCLGSGLYHTRTVLQEERETREQLERSPSPSERPQTEKLRASSSARAPPPKDIPEEKHSEEGEWQAVTHSGPKQKSTSQGE